MYKDSSIDEAEIAKFADLANDWWDKDGPLKTLHDINQVRVDYISKYIDLAATQVLDLGCGGGILSEAMANNGALVTGIDAETNAIQIAKQHAKQQNLDIDYQCLAVENYTDKQFAAITCLEMLEHVQDPELIIKSAHRLLKPGGFLFLSTINRTIKSYLKVIVAAEYLLNLIPKQTHDFAKFIKPSELLSLLRKYSFELIDISGIAYNPFSRQAKLDKSVDDNYLLVCKLDN